MITFFFLAYAYHQYRYLYSESVANPMDSEVTQLSKFQGRTVNYGSVRADQNYKKKIADKWIILYAESTKITQSAIFKMYPCCTYMDFSVSQSNDKSTRSVHRIDCMSLWSFFTPQG